MRRISIRINLKFGGFNPRICKRCDYTDEFCNPFKRVSIHASVKDATGLVGSLFVDGSGFNPRICKRCDFGSPFLFTPSLFQSTHL